MIKPYPKPTKSIKNKTRIKQGTKGKEWTAAKRRLKKAFQQAGITYDELTPYLLNNPKYAEMARHCRPGYFLTWAHGDKRRHLQENELYSLVVLAGIDAHNVIEKLPRQEMRAIVEEIIQKRQTQPETAQQQSTQEKPKHTKRTLNPNTYAETIAKIVERKEEIAEDKSNYDY